MSPAGAAILWDVLLADSRKEVGTADIVPEPLVGEVNVGKRLTRVESRQLFRDDAAGRIFRDTTCLSDSFGVGKARNESEYSKASHFLC